MVQSHREVAPVLFEVRQPDGNVPAARGAALDILRLGLDLQFNR
jgi:hypothetical protein